MRALSIAPVFVAAVAACSTGGSNGPSTATYAGFALAAQQEICARSRMCPTDRAGYFTTLYTGGCDGPPSTLVTASLAANRIQYDPGAAALCIAELRGLRCAIEAGDAAFPPVCGRVVTGSIGVGQACAFSNECASGLCVLTSSTDQCAATCMDRVALGAACRSGAQCDAGADAAGYCNITTPGADGTCVSVTPVRTRAALGARCGFDTETDPLRWTSTACAEGLICSTANEPTCVHPPAENEPCIAEVCGRGLFCNRENVCVRVPTLAQGAACEANGSTGFCDLGRDLFCDGGSCAPFRAADAACEIDMTDGFDNCGTGLRCIAGRCAPAKTEGAPCTSPSECRLNYCVNGICASTECG